MAEGLTGTTATKTLDTGSPRFWNNRRFWFIALLMLACSLFYYLDFVIDFMGRAVPTWYLFVTGHEWHLTLFLLPIIYAAYIFRMRGIVVATLVALLIFVPDAILYAPFLSHLLRAIVFLAFAAVAGALLASVQDRKDQIAQAYTIVKESEEKYRTLTEKVNDVVFTLDITGKFTYLSPRFQDITGQLSQDWLGHSFAEVLVPEYAAGTVEHFKQGLLGEAGPLLEVEVSFGDGTRIPVELNMTSLLDAGGQTVGRLGIARDMTERKKAQEALQMSEKQYRDLFEQSREAIYISTREGSFLDINQSMLDLLGYDREEMLAVDIKNLYANPDERHAFQQEIEQGTAVVDYPVKLRSKDGAEIDCLLTSVVRMADGYAVAGYQGIIRRADRGTPT